MSVSNNDSSDVANATADPLREAVEKAIRQLFGSEDTLSVDAGLPLLPRPKMSMGARRRISEAERGVSNLLLFDRLLATAQRHRRNIAKVDTDSDLIPTASTSEQRAILCNSWCERYVQAFRRLDIQPAKVVAYIRQEMRLLGSMYFAAREPAPSPDKLRRLAIQLALDARQPIDGDLKRYKLRREGCRMKLVLSGAQKAPGSPQPNGDVTKISPLVPEVLRHVFKSPPDAIRMVGWIEDVLGRQPERQDTLESARGDDVAEDQPTPLTVGAIGAEARTSVGGPATVIVFVSPGVYRIGEGEPFKVDASYDEVLRPFLKQPAMDKRELVAKSGHDDAPRILGRLVKKFDGRFAPFIQLPGRKANLGYRVMIRQNQPAVERAPITHP